MHCSLLAEQAIKAAIDDYKTKQQKIKDKDKDKKPDITEETLRVLKNIEEKSEEVKL